MVKRCVFFTYKNTLYKKTVEVNWDLDSIKFNQINCRKEIVNQVPSFISPSTDVSTTSPYFSSRQLSILNVKDSEGKPVKELWAEFDKSVDANLMPPGCYDLIYITSLNEEQVRYALCQRSYFDIYYNPDKGEVCSAKALASLQLLHKQGKVDYVLDINKFLWWYYINCAYPMEWLER